MRLLGKMLACLIAVSANASEGTNDNWGFSLWFVYSGNFPNCI